MSIFKLLGLKKNATEKEIKTHYIRRLIQVHPDRPSGSKYEYLKLNNAYEAYIRDRGFQEMPYAVCMRTEIHSISCRCGEKYKPYHEVDNRIDCECCSCFIEIEDGILQIDATH
ncbi:hypothetical protein CWI42_030520 [Ordospora colligata]|uniref:J domain-containing protein n=1 Tax=Ordospora colligata OC4 TaxID=1354746 RepID=A0A0B2UKZ3_9MICR|nr:uncharacterized protein M896_030230 [Ordospora colligata OC4]KHN70038.1 hypothetical protein M896_030230 [Ordospora colligata OC4]TBU16420.1 hypothetical protein CWI41_030190 [Ordospora colligata]TBU16605.1 hypothetical protein CWI40_030590 [Ordospora colligata]TBU19178.1 hypothetical protein CWI42_030520 [Ordospora colligata]